ncbi:hypothetical protein QUF50_02110 [Thiotrichales bacterium HSG1]|nr:hypothetical protein [Thiotrichales bacterium HSG1]
MKSTTKSIDLPTLTTEIFSNPSMPIDNVLAQLWKTMRLPTLLQR